MKYLDTVEHIVYNVLRVHPEARDSDMELYYLVSIRFFILTHGKSILQFEDVMRNYRTLGIPCFESVRRTRQKIQSRHPELGCSPKIRRARTKAQKEFRDYVRQEERI